MPPATVALATPPPPGLAEATKNSLNAWQHHLAELFRGAKERFPDVVWELTAEDDDERVIDEVWGHKAVVYARAPPSFQSRYFSFRPHPVSSPTPDPSQSAFSLSSSPVPQRTASPSTLAPNASLLRITSSINPALFSNELEYLYTGQGFGEAFEFLFDSAHDGDHDVDPEDLRIDKLRKDLVFMWRSRLYSDVRIALSSAQENTTAIFSSHRFVLVSRSPYFYDALLSWPQKPPKDEIPTLTLPSPPFTPPSLHFTLGFIYTGTLVFSHRTYDLSTAFAILKAALYLSLPSLHDEIQARIAHEMLHGLFHAFLPFQEYERLTQSKWGTGGCRCRQCARRAPRVLEFSLEEDVKNTHLERGARRALVGLFGEGWCTQEFASLNVKLRESLLKGVAKRTTPQNVFPLLFAAEHALVKLSSVIDPWADTVREMVLNGRKTIDEVICKDAEAVFSNEEWMEIMEGDGARFDDTERVQWAMAAVIRGVKESWAPSLYQTLVSNILIKPHPTEPNAPFLSSTSQLRQQVEQTRIELCKWISKRWLQIRQEHGFDALEGWAIKELSDYMEVPIEDLLSPTPLTRGSPRNKHTPNRISSHPHTSRIDADSEAASSMRVSVLSRNLASSRRGARDNASIHSSVSSIRSSAKSTISAVSDSTVGRLSSRGGDSVNTGMSPARRIVQATRARDAASAAAAKDRPDSKLTPASPSLGSRETSPTPQPSLQLPPAEEDDDDGASSIAASEPESPSAPAIKKTVITRASIASSTRSHTPNNPSPQAARTPTTVKLSPSSASIRSQARKSTVSVKSAATGARSTGTNSRPVSRTSTTRTLSTASTLSRISTARSSSATSTTASTTSSLFVSRPVSAVSTSTTRSAVSTAESSGTYRTASTGGGGLSTPQVPRSRKSSAASTSSVRTAGPAPSPSPISPSTSGGSERRTRKISTSSVGSTGSAGSSVSAYGTAKSSGSHARSPNTNMKMQVGTPLVPVVDPTKLSPVAAVGKGRVKSGGSLRSVKSGSSVSRRTGTVGGGVLSVVRTSSSPGKSGSSEPLGSPVRAKSLEEKEEKEYRVEGDGDGDVEMKDDTMEVQQTVEEEEKVKNTVLSPGGGDITHKKTDSTTSTGSNATVRKRKSNETVLGAEGVARSGSGSGGSGSASARSSGDTKTRLLDKPQPPLPPHSPTPPPPPSSHIADTETELSYADPAPPPPPQGITLDIGIPCIISSKRKRFKAYARYIGEVQGEYGPWVGVEVPIPLGESWADRDKDSGWRGVVWNDGSWGGVKYFDVGGGSTSPEYGYGYDERRRRADGSSWTTLTVKTGGVKREGEQLDGGVRGQGRMVKRMRSVSPAVSDGSGAESRGLFVRPQQVLYVVDAVEDL